MKQITILFSAFFLLQFCEINAQSGWTQKAGHLGAARYDFAGFSTNGKGYIGGGRYGGPFNSLSEWQEYNPLTNTWIIINSMTYPFTALTAFEVGGYGYIANGVNDAFYNYDTYKYNHLGNNWSTLASMTYPRLYAASTSNGSKGFLIGGYGFSAEPLNDLQEYDPLLDIWTEKETLPLSAARYYSTAFSINGNVYVFGGWNDIDYLNDLWKYDTATNHWSQMSSMPADGRQQSLAFVLNNEAFIIGGTSNSGNLKEVWKYNASNNSWLQLANFPGTNAPFGGVSFTINGKGYIVPANGTVECWEFDLGTLGIQFNSEGQKNINLYPNPVINISTVDFPSDYTAPIQIDIYDCNGKKIKSINTTSNKMTIDIHDYSKGIYFLRAQDRMSKTGIVKFMIQ